MRTNSKEVIKAVREHILNIYDERGIKGLKEDINAVKYGNMNNIDAIKHMVEGGSFLIYDIDIINFLNGLGINPENKKYPVDKSRELYKNLIIRECLKLINSN